MKILFSDITKKIPDLSWTIDELAEKLSLIGHETGVVGESLDVTLTANRKDCQQLPYLLFDLLAVYPELGSNVGFIEVKPGKKINVTLQRVNSLLGSAVTKEQYAGLSRLGFEVSEDAVTTPDFRVDVFEAADIAEEVFRLTGAKAINVSMLSKQDPVTSIEYERQQSIRAALVNAGLQEIRTVSFAAKGEIALKTPFSNDLPYLRPNLLEGLLQTLAKNPFIRRASFFEIGNVFDPEEQTNIGVIFSGNKNTEVLAQSMESALGTKVSLTAPETELLHRYNVKQPNVVYGEISIESIPAVAMATIKTALPAFKQISKFPPMVRDVSITSPGGDIFVKNVHQQFPELLFIELVDTYIDPETKRTTNTYRLVFQKSSESFTQQEISEIDQRIDQHFFQVA